MLLQALDRDVDALRLWDQTDDPGFAGFCGVDAHGLVALAPNLAAWTLVASQIFNLDESLNK